MTWQERLALKQKVLDNNRFMAVELDSNGFMLGEVYCGQTEQEAIDGLASNCDETRIGNGSFVLFKLSDEAKRIVARKTNVVSGGPEKNDLVSDIDFEIVAKEF